MAKAKTTAELTKEVDALKAQIDALWEFLRVRMDGDGQVTRAMAKAAKG